MIMTENIEYSMKILQYSIFLRSVSFLYFFSVSRKTAHDSKTDMYLQRSFVLRALQDYLRKPVAKILLG